MVDFAKKLQESKGYFDKFLAFDCETSGMCFDGHDPSKGYQMVSAGLIVANLKFEPVEELYVEIKYNDKNKWESKAESIHGLSKEHLEKHGQPEIIVAEKIGGLLFDHFGTDNKITLLGTNAASFDVFFLRKLLSAYDLPFSFSHRAIDTFSLSMGTVGEFTSDGLFDCLGFKKRDKHNALDDARMALNTYKIINKMWKKYVEGV